MRTRTAGALALVVGVTACRPFDEAAPAAAVEVAVPDAGGVTDAGVQPDAAIRSSKILVDDPTSTTLTDLRGTTRGLYWIAGGTRLKRADKITGGAEIVLESRSLGPHGGGIPSITSDASTVYAIVYGLGAEILCRTAMAVDDTSRERRDLGYACDGAGAISVRGGRVAFGGWRETNGTLVDLLYTVDSATKTEKSLTIGAAQPVDATCIANDRVYFTSRDRTSIRFVSLAAFDAVAPFAQGFGTLTSLACDDAGVVWATKAGKLFTLAHDKANAQPETIVTAASDAHAIVLRGTDVFFAVGDRLRAITRSGKEDRVVWRATNPIDSLVVDADAIFVATAPRTIFRLDR